MKQYVSPNHMRIVGQVWEVRAALKQWMHDTSAHATLASLLPRLSDDSTASVQPAAEQQAVGKQQRIQRTSSPSAPHIIPFPSS